MVLEEWGPTAVKFGQLLATRPDLLPDPYLMELRKLADSVPPFDATEARRIIEAELGKPVTELFREFDAEPIAAGSIAQAHTALLHSGEPVVIKVKRPSVEEVMLADLDLLEAVIVPLLEWLEDLRPLQPAMLVREFRRSLRRELDFVAEASITRKIRADLAKISFVRVPLVYWNLTTSNVLTLQRLSGVRLTDSKALAALKVDCKRTARQIAEVFLSQFFMTGLFHADPHPGNLLLTEDGGIALLDFGMAGRLDRELRSNLATTLIALVRGDLDMIVETYMDIGVLSDDTDIAALKTDVHEILDKYYGIPARCININRCLADIMTVARTHNVLLPRDFVMLCKSFCTMVMLARELDPEFDLSVVAKSFAASLIRQKLSPVRLGHDAVAGFWGLSQTLRRLPREIRTFARKLASGKLQFQVEHHVNAFEGFARELDRATNRLAFSVIVGSIVIGSALILHARVPPYLDTVLPGRLAEFFSRYMPQTSVLGLGGFLFAGVLGLLLAIAIWRHGRL
jgi:ubiquinone biosynthesis protein